MKSKLNKMNIKEFKEHLNNKKIKYELTEHFDFPRDIAVVSPKSKNYKSTNTD